MHRKNQKIAVFDSGVGGISVLRQLAALLPNENYLYYGDSANAPYGGRTTAQVQKLTLDAVDMLMDRGIKALVIACNTATAAAIDLLRQKYPELIVVGIEPALKLAADRFPRGHIGVMATQVTLREEKLAHQMERFPHVTVERIPAPGLVELVESGLADSPQTEALLGQVLAPYLGKLDALVLGCTHYPFAKNTIERILGEGTVLLDGSEGTARQTQRCLERAGLLNDGPGSIQIENSLQSREILELCGKLLRDFGG